MMWDSGAHVGLMSLWWVLLLGGIFLVTWLVGRVLGSNSGSRESAEQALKKRYARGEIDQRSYEEMLRTLRH